MSKRARERKLRKLEEQNSNINLIRARERERVEPYYRIMKLLGLVVGSGVVLALLIFGGMKIVNQNKAVISGPFGEISKSELQANKFATLETNKGNIKIELDTKNTPKTAANFELLAKKDFYNGTKFHRIIKDFMIQGGDVNSKDDDPNNDGQGDPGYAFDDEKIVGDYKRGVVAMANAGPNTNGSQFFILHADYDLPKKYVIFGRVVEGMETVDAIANTPVEDTGREVSRPTEPIVMNKVTLSAN